MNALLLIVDSLRASAVFGAGAERARTPFLDALSRQTVCFRRAYATECWTLPTHVSMFTGLLPSEHGAHFRTMAYAGPAPTIAETLRARGYHTELVSRNPVLDGTLPGVTRGFARNTRIYAREASGLHPLALLLALSKPRFRRQIRRSGFFSAAQRETAAFSTTSRARRRPPIHRS